MSWVVVTGGMPFVYAVSPGDVPSSASVEVIQSKIETDAQTKMTESTQGHEVEVIEELPPIKSQEDIPFFVKNIFLTGEQVLPPDQLDKLIEPYEDREITFTQLRELMREIEIKYRGEGFLELSFYHLRKLPIRKSSFVPLFQKWVS